MFIDDVLKIRTSSYLFLYIVYLCLIDYILMPKVNAHPRGPKRTSLTQSAGFLQSSSPPFV